jgi:hypothetical protein
VGQQSTSASPRPDTGIGSWHGWTAAALGASPRDLLINTAESTSDESDPCFIHYRADLISSSQDALTIALVQTSAATTTCPLVGKKGPFFVHLELTTDYHSQKLIDALTSLERPLVDKSQIS